MTEDEPINNAMGKPQLTRKQRQNLSDTGKPWMMVAGGVRGAVRVLGGWTGGVQCWGVTGGLGVR